MVGRPISPVWRNFIEITKDGVTVVKCKTCEVELSYNTKDSSTGSMRKHVKLRHSELAKDMFATTTTTSTSTTAKNQIASTSTDTDKPKIQTMKSFLESKKSLDSNSPRAQTLTKGLVHMICTDLQPPSFTEDKGFRDFMKAAEPRYTIPSRATFRNILIPNLYTEVMKKLTAELQGHMSTDSSSISVTTDGWTSTTGASYITYTIHFIQQHFSMVAYNLGTFESKASHTSVHLKQHLYQVLALVGILVDHSVLSPSNSNVQEQGEVTEPRYDDNEKDMDMDDEDGIENLSVLVDESERDREELSETDQRVVDNLLKKVDIFITTDNASNISKAVEESDFTHVRCFAHTVNLAAQKGLNTDGIKKQLVRVRKVVKFFKKSNKAEYALEVSVLLCYCYHVEFK